MCLMISDARIQEIRDMVKLNDHGSAYQLAARTLGCEDLAALFEGVNRRHAHFGYLTQNLSDERTGLYQRLLAEAKKVLSAGDYQRFYMSL